jgi:membrane protein DedA with SNARE-associated domain
MDQVIVFVQNWGYWAVFFGAMLEGEAVIIAAAYMAYRGYLSLPIVIALAFLGTFISEQILYYVGRMYGGKIIEKYPKLKEPSERVFALLKKYDRWFILSCRFIYGIRNISPLAIGMSGISPKRYLPLNMTAALIWSVVCCGGAYSFGATIEHWMNNIEKTFTYMFFGVVTIAIGGYYYYKNQNKS